MIDNKFRTEICMPGDTRHADLLRKRPTGISTPVFSPIRTQTVYDFCQFCPCMQIHWEQNRNDLTVITTNLLPDTPELLNRKITHATIFQNPYKQGKNVVKCQYAYLTENTNAGLHVITPEIILSSNLASYIFNDSPNATDEQYLAQKKTGSP